MSTPALGNSATFESLPITNKIKIFKKNKGELQTITMKEGELQNITLHLLGDTLIVTSTPSAFENERMKQRYALLYPPMPLSHVNFVARVSEKDIYELRLSPYKMLAIRATNAKAVSFIWEVLEDAQTDNAFEANSDMESVASASDRLAMSTV
jgi:hypothetical protein